MAVIASTIMIIVVLASIPALSEQQQAHASIFKDNNLKIKNIIKKTTNFFNRGGGGGGGSRPCCVPG